MTAGIESQVIVPSTDIPAIRHLEQAVASGEHWYVALIEAISLWEMTSEVYKGHTYRYIIAGEALDWLVLAERLCDGVITLIPENEKEALLFQGKPPLELSADEFKRLISTRKYQQYLNYFYGVTVEEALRQAVREGVRKERWALGYHEGPDYDDETYRRIYGTGETELLRVFRKEMGYQHLNSTSLTELKEFTYWLFKYRIRQSDPARVASDTKKALDQLASDGYSDRLPGRRNTGTTAPVANT